MFTLPQNSNRYDVATRTELEQALRQCLERDQRLRTELGVDFRERAPENYILIEIRSAWYFFKCVEAVQRHFGARRRMLYRGHADSDYELTPSLMRRQLFGYTPAADQVVAAELTLLGNFQRQGRPFIHNLPLDREQHWEWVSLAQHHRLPTRLLDWSYRAGVALYFAVGASERRQSSRQSCVWCILAPEEITAAKAKYPSSVAKVFLFNPPHISPRIIAQQACFTVHPSHYLDRYYKWIEGPKIIFTVEDEFRSDIEDGLRALGLHHASMFPDLDGIAEFIATSFDPKDA